MIRAVILLALLGGCAARVPVFPSWPPPVPEPVGVRPHPTPRQIGALEIRVELAREAERQRADACADAVVARDAWIRGRQ